MKITLKQLGQDFHLEASNAQGNHVLMDSAPEAGGQGKGLRPMELVLSALGGCSAMDVISILKKQKQEITGFEVDVQGTREKTGDYSLFKEIVLRFQLTGPIDAGKLERAVLLSLEKYCSVAKTLEPTARIRSIIHLNGTPLTPQK